MALRVGEIVLDPSAHTVTNAGDPVDLTLREFAMLEYLMRRQGQTVSKTELVENVWSARRTDPNCVEVYAGYLRRKLGRHIVQTVRGVGYRLPQS